VTQFLGSLIHIWHFGSLFCFSVKSRSEKFIGWIASVITLVKKVAQIQRNVERFANLSVYIRETERKGMKASKSLFQSNKTHFKWLDISYTLSSWAFFLIKFFFIQKRKISVNLTRKISMTDNENDDEREWETNF